MRRALSILLAALALLVPVLAVPAPAVAADGPVITGRAVDADGLPVAGATVVLVDVRGAAVGSTTAVATAGEDGRFAVASGPRPAQYVVGVCLDDSVDWAACSRERDGLQLLTTYVGTDGPQPSLLHVGGYHRAAATEPVELGDVPLQEPATLRVLTDESEGPSVALRDGAGWGVSAELVDGVVTFRGIRPGRYRLSLHWPIGDDSGEVRPIEIGPGVTTIDASGPDAVVHGTLSLDGEPLAWVPVSLVRKVSSGRRGATWTRRDGSFVFSGIQPSVRPWLLRIGAGRITEDAPVAVLRRVSIPTRETSLRVDVRLRRDQLGTVTGRFPERHAEVDLYDGRGARIGDTWTRGARHQLRLPPLVPGTYRLHGTWFDRREDRWEQAWRTFRVRPGRTTALGELRAAPTPGRLVVRAPAGTGVRLTRGAPSWVRQPPAGARSVGPDGRVTFSGLARGTYEVRLATYGKHLPPAARTVRVGRDVARVRIRRGPEGGSLHGLLVDARTGRAWPWANGFAKVTCRLPGSDERAQFATVVRRAEGPVFELSRLRAGRWKCELQAAGANTPYHLTMDQTFHVRAGQRTSVRVPVGITGG